MSEADSSTEPPDEHWFDWFTRGKITALICCAALVAIFVTTAMLAVSGKSATFDEPMHLVAAWIQVHCDDFRCDPENPPLWKSWAVWGTQAQDLAIDQQTPYWNLMLRSGVQAAYAPVTLYMTGADALSLLANARAHMIVLGAILAMVVGWWAWRLAGPMAAVVAVAAYCFDPNFLAHSPLVKNDVPMAMAFVVFAAGLWLVGEKTTYWRLALLTLATGAALTIKYNGILCPPILALGLLIRAFIPQPWPILQWTANSLKQRIAAVVSLGVVVAIGTYFIIWGCYGFRFGPSEKPNQKFDVKYVTAMTLRTEAELAHGAPANMTDEQVEQWVKDQPMGTVDRLYRWADANQILPQTWLHGLYYAYGKGLVRPTFLVDQYSLVGWWYYFPLTILFKTPVTTLLAILLAAGLWLRIRCSAAKKQTRSMSNVWNLCAVLIVPVIYMIAAMRGNVDAGVRHILNVYAFLFIFLGVAAAEAWHRWRKPTVAILGILLLGLLLETYGQYPNYIAFFNVAVGGPREGVKLLGGSNIDWGQDLPLLADWQAKHADYQLYLNYDGQADPRYYGVHYISVDGSWAPHDELEPKPLPPVLALSVCGMQGAEYTPQQRNFYRQFLDKKPLAVLGNSIYLFDHVEDCLPKPRELPGAENGASPAPAAPANFPQQ